MPYWRITNVHNQSSVLSEGETALAALENAIKTMPGSFSIVLRLEDNQFQMNNGWFLCVTRQSGSAAS